MTFHEKRGALYQQLDTIIKSCVAQALDPEPDSSFAKPFRDVLLVLDSKDMRDCLRRAYGHVALGAILSVLDVFDGASYPAEHFTLGIVDDETGKSLAPQNGTYGYEFGYFQEYGRMPEEL